MHRIRRRPTTLLVMAVLLATVAGVAAAGSWGTSQGGAILPADRVPGANIPADYLGDG